MNNPDAEDWRVVLRTDRAVARSIVGMTVADGAGVSLGRVIEARAEPVQEGETT